MLHLSTNKDKTIPATLHFKKTPPSDHTHLTWAAVKGLKFFVRVYCAHHEANARETVRKLHYVIPCIEHLTTPWYFLVSGLLDHASKKLTNQVIWATPTINFSIFDEEEGLKLLGQECPSIATDVAASLDTIMMSRPLRSPAEALDTASVNTTKCTDRLAIALTDYSKTIILSVQGEGDVHIWDVCILRFRNAFATLDKETKANAVTTARAAAETSNTVKPIQEIMKEGMTPLDKRIAEIKRLLKADPQAQISAPKPTAKPPKADAKGKGKACDPQPTKNRKDGPNAKHADTDGSELSKLKKGKKKAKVVELQTNRSK
ncbi:hypothetical protein B0H14DRAFT_3500951 [Mycena olivaceomarginata]|nr:hypothetical protein B0H14DRAFT_3500951 [Mycena olivaceomarginata]